VRKALIDTNIYSLAMKGDEIVANTLRRIDRIGFSVVSIGELYSGFKGGRQEQKNREELDIFLDSPRVVLHAIDEGTADYYASILNDLRSQGTPIPTNDIWIAAIAFQYGYKLFTRDDHFRLVPGLLHLS
jgi:tRNA(fMet)-specific endonuclease VapC